jgi:hypothetical protein
MKKIIALSLLILTTFSFTSCKKKVKSETKSIENLLSVDAKTTIVNWTAYKTTSKVPVKGQFSDLIIENPIKASTSMEALNGLKFSIPIRSLITNDTIRDGKLKKFFFGTLKNTNLITGTISMDTETSGSVTITMNGISQVLPIVCNISEQTVAIEALMNLDNWKAQAAIEALNAACKDLHTGDDGITKTWSDVKIEVTAHLKYE